MTLPSRSDQFSKWRTFTSAVYTSADLDFVVRFGESVRDVTEALRKIGFHREAGYFAHPLTSYTLDFPPGPLAVVGA